jgi:hypothetical protein
VVEFVKGSRGEKYGFFKYFKTIKEECFMEAPRKVEEGASTQ